MENQSRNAGWRAVSPLLASIQKRSELVKSGQKGYELEDFSNVFERYLRSEHQVEFGCDSVTNEGKGDSVIRGKSENVTDAEIPR